VPGIRLLQSCLCLGLRVLYFQITSSIHLLHEMWYYARYTCNTASPRTPWPIRLDGPLLWKHSQSTKPLRFNCRLVKPAYGIKFRTAFQQTTRPPWGWADHGFASDHLSLAPPTAGFCLYFDPWFKFHLNLVSPGVFCLRQNTRLDYMGLTHIFTGSACTNN